MTEETKVRYENQLETLDAILAAIKVASKWLSERYPNPYISPVEEQTMKEVHQDLNKAEQALLNFINTILP